jgi:hypothetical protein
MLALFRFWNVIHYFYPYLPLMGDAWERALVDFIPRFEAAADAHEYALTVAELAARIPDGHVNVWGSKELRSTFGAARAPFEVRVVEGEPDVARRWRVARERWSHGRRCRRCGRWGALRRAHCASREIHRGVE